MDEAQAENREQGAATVEPFRVLVIDDEPAILAALREDLESLGCRVAQAETARLGLALAEEFNPDAILLDFHMPVVHGLGALVMLKRSPVADIPVILISGDWSLELMRGACAMGAYDCLPKPYHALDLQVRVGNAARYRRLAERLRALEEQHRRG